MKYLSRLKRNDLFKEVCLVRAGFDIVKEDFDLLGGGTHLRIQAISPTLDFLQKKGVKTVILSHRGRPKAFSSGIKDEDREVQIREFGMRPFAEILAKKLARKVNFIELRLPLSDFFRHAHSTIHEAPPGSIFLLENLRFMEGEIENSVALGRQLAGLGTMYVNESFSVGHRSNASLVAITKFIPSYAGLFLEREMRYLSHVLKTSKKPLVIVLGGAKISDKIWLVKKFLPRAQFFLMGGGIANTFNAAMGIDIGDSLFEKEMIPAAKKFLKSGKIILPVDFITEGTKRVDIGPKTIVQYRSILKSAKVVIWNGPLGMITDKRYRKGSENVARAIINSKSFAVVGGGETTAVFQMVSKKEHHSILKDHDIFLSTGGGAMLQYLAGLRMPGIEALKSSNV